MKKLVLLLYTKLYAVVRNLFFHFAKYGRKNYLINKRRKNKNKEISIITNNCVGGIIYSDLGLEFLSPTINLFFQLDDYFEFLNNLEDYLKCELIQKESSDVSYPIGILKNQNKEVAVHFMHYKSFEEAKDKWCKRAKRVNFNNLYVIFEYTKDTDYGDPYYIKFKELPFIRKRMLAYAPTIQDKEVVHFPFYHDDYYPGKILQYPRSYSIRRYLDRFDYVSFFNKT